ncbi:MAG TPA: ATP-binding protein, partial [Verrucomicrobiae bacterium]|nr:ATP-binding protein [Verrucomicrobiae bacterium]
SVFYPVVDNDRTYGIVYLQSDLTTLTDRYRAYAWLALSIIVGSIVIAYLLSLLLQKQISRPVLMLAETAGAITKGSDFSLRATKYGNDELGLLTDTFNQLLGSIEERNKSLQAEIVERKGAENKAQAQLARLELLHRITRATGERQDLQSIFQVVIRTLEEHLPVDFCCICLYDQEARMLTVTGVGVRSAALAMELAMTKQSRVEIDENGLSRCVNGHLVYEPDVEKIKFPFPQRLARGGLRALVASPLLVESKVFGILISARRTAGSFSSGECEFLKQLSEHVALAAHQAQLYEALRKAYDDLRLTQQAVMQQERLKALGQMASGIAHDINNAISPVALYTESLLEKEPQLSPRARDYLTTIQRAIDDVAQTVSRMREFYRQREPQLMSRPVQLNPLIQQVIDLSRARWSDIPQQRGIFISTETVLTPDLPVIMGMESEIREALVNLVFNAVDAMPEGGTLTLRTKAPKSAGQPVLVEVSDTGVGMDEDTRRRCWEPFFTTKGERGTGLGLAMVYGTVRRHGGEIEIESKPGQGTTMRISFPVPAAAPVTDGKHVPVPAVPLRQRILVVDDDPLLIKSLRDTLETDGHLIVAASAGQEGIDLFRKAHTGGEPFAVVITDLGMPYVDGRQVSAEVKKLSPNTPVIMLTGWGQRLVAEDDVPPHVDMVLSKPPKLRDLREALAKCLQPKTP